MDIRIEKGIPIPHGNATYPWHLMEEVGDSFFVPCPNGEKPIDTQRRMTSSAFLQAKKRGTKYSVRQMGNGVRVWRMA